MKKYKTAYVVSHSHWDREWYLSHAKHNFNLVQFMDRLISVLENDDEFKSFHLDGQIILLDDYLAVRPNMKDRVKKLIDSGKLKVGPFYILQDDYLLSGEANVRNILVGLRETEKYGKPTLIGYFPDTFGNIGQMPQILRSCGIDNVFMGRGTVISDPPRLIGSSEKYFSEFNWKAPDGSVVLTEQFILWYSNGMELPTDKDALKSRLTDLHNNMDKCTVTDGILLMNGCDHEPVQADLSTAIKNARELGFDIEHTTFEDFLKTLKPYSDKFYTVEGEIDQEECNGYRTLRETASTRVYLKQASYKAGYLLESVAEPLGLIADSYGIKNDDDILHYSWKCLLENYPHDSICGCSVDEVHRKMEVRFSETIDTVQSLIDLTGRRLTAKVCKGERSIAVINCYPKKVVDYVECVVDFKDGETVPDKPIVVDQNGKEYSLVVEDLGVMQSYELPEDTFRKVYTVHRFIYKIYGEFAPTALTVLQIKDGENKTQNGVTYGVNYIDNQLIRVDFNKNGSFNVTDKVSGKVVKDQNVYCEIGDKGNEYEFMPTGSANDTLSDVAKIELKKADAHSVTFKIENSLNQQNGEKVTIFTEVTLFAGKKSVDVKVKFVNACKDHRIRADFAWNLDVATHNSSGQFDLTERVNLPHERWTAPHHPRRTFEFIERTDKDGSGQIIALRGNNEYEVCAHNGHTQITLVRGMGILGDWFDFYTYDSQCLREITAEYSVGFYNANEREKVVDWAYSYHHPRLYAFSGIGQGQEVKPSEISFNGEVVATCVRKNAEGESVLRFFNPYDTAKKVEFSKVVTLTDMIEKTNGEKVKELLVEPKKIVTVKF